jgi:hypothetical protein
MKELEVKEFGVHSDKIFILEEVETKFQISVARVRTVLYIRGGSDGNVAHVMMEKTAEVIRPW